MKWQIWTPYTANRSLLKDVLLVQHDLKTTDEQLDRILRIGAKAHTRTVFFNHWSSGIVWVAVGCLLLWRLVVHDRNNDAIQVQLYRDNARVVGLMAVATSQDLQANLRSNELGFIAFGQRTNNEQAILNSLYHRAVRLITERRHGHDLGTPWLEGMKR